jgi:hypothetical protein
MTSLYNPNLPEKHSQTHVIIIGVSAYPHLPGGEKADTEPAPKGFGLAQLTSPVPSAAALTNWLLEHHNNPGARLGSIELLLSPGVYTPSHEAAKRLGVTPGMPLSVEEANFDAIEKAASRWYIKANKHCDNVAWFYFCGHGLEASDRYLLPRDFGANPLNWTANIINLTQTYNNMDHCFAKTQCFFIDACRDQLDEVQKQAARTSVGRPLIGPQSGSIQDRDWRIYHAAAPGQSAAGPPNGESYFTSALLGCLGGMGAREQNGTHAPVDHESLGSALRELIDRLGEGRQPPLRCEVGGNLLLPFPVDLHLASTPVDVLTIVQCQPKDAHQVARLSLIDSTGKGNSRQKPGEQPWRVTAKAGKCSVEAKFDPAHPFADFADSPLVGPPVYKLSLPISPR